MMCSNAAADTAGTCGPVATAALLTSRKLLVLQLLARGLSVGRIAAVLIVSSREVEAMLDGAAARLGARDRLEAVAMVRQRGLVV